MITKHGLNDYPRMVKGAGLTCKLRYLYWQLRYAWQRAWRGYDHNDIVDIGGSIVRKLPTLLREFKARNFALFYDEDLGRTLDKNETNQVIDDLIFYFENCDEDVVVEHVLGHEWTGTETWDEIKKVSDEQNRCMDEAMKLFSKWCFRLWY